MRTGSWTAAVKDEIAGQGFSTDCCKRAFLSGLLHAAGSLILSHDGLSVELTLDRRTAAKKATRLFLSAYGVRAEEEGRSLRFRDPVLPAVLADLGVFSKGEASDGTKPAYSLLPGIPPALVRSTCCKANYLRGAFIGAGSLSVGDGYRLTLALESAALAEDIARLLSDYSIGAAVTARKGKAVVTLNDLESISDCLALLGAGETVAGLQSESVLRNVRQNANRALNCELGNLTKLVEASLKQTEAIKRLRAADGLDALPRKLKEAAEVRLSYPEDSLEALAARLGISKSALKYRLAQLIKRSETL
ncbi:MAG: DNA-binding protein WhiA [Clostridiales bacterium]|jgi:DNA-binding protein WhiA|nr:DNA-binding protein WhiA [Clostridiales bacterium]